MLLFLECEADLTLVRSFGIPERQCIHHSGCGEVCRALQKRTGAIGMVDEDPHSSSPSYLRSLRELSDEHGIRVLEDTKHQHRVVMLRPRLEEWIIQTAKASNLKMEDFSLSENPRHLHGEINSRLPNLGRLLARLAQLGSPRLRHLRQQLPSSGK